jgi:hypothetical protein
VIVAIAYIGYNLMTEEWFKSMDTIHHAGQDGSFMERVVAWKIATLIALDSPILGAGIKGPETKLSLNMHIVSDLALSKAYFDLSFSIYAMCRVLERHVKTERNDLRR